MNMELPSGVKKMLDNNLMCHQGTMMENSRNASLTCRWPCKNQILLRLWGQETRETLPRQMEMHSGTATLEHRQLTENQPHSRIWSNSGIFAELSRKHSTYSHTWEVHLMSERTFYGVYYWDLKQLKENFYRSVEFDYFVELSCLTIPTVL